MSVKALSGPHITNSINLSACGSNVAGTVRPNKRTFVGPIRVSALGQQQTWLSSYATALRCAVSRKNDGSEPTLLRRSREATETAFPQLPWQSLIQGRSPWGGRPEKAEFEGLRPSIRAVHAMYYV